MIVRSLDENGDWTFGAGINNYKRANLAVAQCLQTRLSSFIGNCFFDMGAGINWFGYLGGKGSNNTIQLSLALSAVILNTPNVNQNGMASPAVLGIKQLGFNVTTSRGFSITYQVQTVYSSVNNSFTYDLGG